MSQPEVALPPNLSPARFADLPGWDEDNLNAALLAFRGSAEEILEKGHGFSRQSRFGGSREDWLDVCREALVARQPREFFETWFLPFRVRDLDRPQGLITGYFEPEALGSRRATVEYPAAVYSKPADLVSLDAATAAAAGVSYGRYVNGSAQPYFTRKEIEQGALAGKGLEICWLKSWEDAFFIHIQGSGLVRLPDGSALRLAYAGKSGQPYTGIGGVLVDRGILTPETMSMQGIRQWMSEHPSEARELMWLNRSFIFFREVPITDPSRGAPGAQYVPLSPRRSLAVDRSIWAFGTPLWLDTSTPPDAPGGAKPFQHLMIAQDTGTAIRGMVRGDVYWGWGDAAAEMAGRMKSPGTMTALLPRRLVSKLLHP